uniref:U1 small nuclear ribonucleoprotein C n=1 Tax=Panthera tigris altaica TaxID=74533 RepID=A0A8C9M683_PANTA
MISQFVGLGHTSGLLNMSKFYCHYCKTYLTHDSPSMRKIHCSGQKHKKNVKDYFQKWMEEHAQISWVLLTLHPIWGPPMMQMMGLPPPGMMPMGPTPRMNLRTGGHMSKMPGPPVMRPPAHPMMVPTWPGMNRPDK